MSDEVILEQKLGFDELLELVHSVNLYDRTKTLKKCIEDELEYVLGKVGEYRRAGELNIKIKFGVGDRCQINVTGEVTSKAPKGSVNQNIFYQDSKDGSLYMDDPSQTKLFAVRNIREESHQKGAVND